MERGIQRKNRAASMRLRNAGGVLSEISEITDLNSLPPRFVEQIGRRAVEEEHPYGHVRI